MCVDEKLTWRQAATWAIEQLLDTSQSDNQKQQRDQAVITRIIGMVGQLETQAAAARQILEGADL